MELFPISNQEMEWIIYPSLHDSGKFYLAHFAFNENILKQRMVWIDILRGCKFHWILMLVFKVEFDEVALKILLHQNKCDIARVTLLC